MAEDFSIDLNTGTNPLFTRPALLLHPIIPRDLYGVNPRTIRGVEWWRECRKAALGANNYCCWACGAYALDTDGPLECHEVYDADYERRKLVFVEAVALCVRCHAFIHYGRLWHRYRHSLASKDEVTSVLGHGLSVLRAAGLELPWAQVLLAFRLELAVSKEEVVKATSGGLDFSKLPGAGLGQAWKLVFEGEEYDGAYPCIRDNAVP